MTALPLPLEHIAEHIAENLPKDEAGKFTDELSEAVGNGDKDLSRVVWRFLGSMLRRLPETYNAIDDVIAGMDLLADGREWPDAPSVACTAFYFAGFVRKGGNKSAMLATKCAGYAAHVVYAADAVGAASSATYAAVNAALSAQAIHDTIKAAEAANAAHVAEIRAQAADLLRFLREA